MTPLKFERKKVHNFSNITKQTIRIKLATKFSYSKTYVLYQILNKFLL